MRSVKYFFQRLFRGYDEVDTWEYCSRFLDREYKPFKAFYEYKKQHICSVPFGFKTEEEWLAVLEEIMWAMEYLYQDERGGHEQYTHKDTERAQKGIELYGKHLLSFWD